MTKRMQALLAVLDRLRKELRIADIGVAPRQHTLFLLGAPRSLNRTIMSPLIVGYQRRQHIDPERTWDRLEYVFRQILNDLKVPTPTAVKTEYGPWDEWTVIPIPSPGGPQVTWWSARKGTKQERVKVKPFSFCDEEPHSVFGTSQGNRPVLLELEGGRTGLPPVFVSHGLGYHDMKAVRDCGGLLWPSMAVTWKVPPAYGDIVFLFDVHLLVNTLRPTGRAQKGVLLAASDIWSPTARELDRLEKAISHELRGTRAWWAGHEKERDGSGRGITREDGYWGQRGLQDKLLLGSASKDDLIGGFAPRQSWTVIRSMNQLWSRIKRLVKVHTEIEEDLYRYEDPDSLTERLAAHGDYYAYLELKVQGLVPADSATACFFPRRRSRTTNRFLDSIGFAGWRVPFSYNGPAAADAKGLDDEERAVWATAATRAILAWSREPCAGRIVIPDNVLSSESMAERHPYQPVAPYSRHKDYSLSREYALRFDWQRGYCPRKNPWFGV